MAKRRMTMKRFNGMVRAAMKSQHKSRIRIFDQAITVAAAAATYNLLNCDDDPDYDITTQAAADTVGTNIAEVQPLSKITGIRLQLGLMDVDAGDAVEWIVYRDPDNSLGDISPLQIFTSDISPTIDMVRKNTLAYGIGFGSTGTDGVQRTVRIRAKAIARAGGLRDGDRLKIRITNNNAVDSIRVYIVGTITWR